MSYTKIDADILRTLQPPRLAYYGALGLIGIGFSFGASLNYILERLGGGIFT